MNQRNNIIKNTEANTNNLDERKCFDVPIHLDSESGKMKIRVEDVLDIINQEKNKII